MKNNEIEFDYYYQDILDIDGTLSKDEACEIVDKLKCEYDDEVGIDRSVIADTIEHYKRMQKYERK